MMPSKWASLQNEVDHIKECVAACKTSYQPGFSSTLDVVSSISIKTACYYRGPQILGIQILQFAIYWDLQSTLNCQKYICKVQWRIVSSIKIDSSSSSWGAVRTITASSSDLHAWPSSTDIIIVVTINQEVLKKKYLTTQDLLV